MARNLTFGVPGAPGRFAWKQPGQKAVFWIPWGPMGCPWGVHGASWEALGALWRQIWLPRGPHGSLGAPFKVGSVDAGPRLPSEKSCFVAAAIMVAVAPAGAMPPAERMVRAPQGRAGVIHSASAIATAGATASIIAATIAAAATIVTA